jgi:hypothetical protein
MSITSANAVYTLTIPGIFQRPVQLHEFATDDIFGTESLKSVETMMGVDGNLTGGFAYVEVKQSVALMADSQSGDIFDQWWQFSQTLVEAYPALGLIILPSVGKQYVMQKGYLTGYKPIPDAKKTLQPRTFEITWQRIIANPLAVIAPAVPTG